MSFDILGVALKIYIQRLIFPHGAFAATYNGRSVGEDVFAGVLSCSWGSTSSPPR